MAVVEPLFECGPLLGSGVPAELGQRADARKEHEIDVVGRLGFVRDVEFAPEGPLESEDVRLLGGGEALLREVEAVGFPGIEDGCPVVALLFGGLPHVEIEILPRHDDGRIALCGSLPAGLDALPPVDRAVAGEGAVGDGLVPHRGPLSAAHEHLREPVREVVLKPGGRAHPPLPHQGAAVGAALPLRAVHLVAADMDELRGEEPADLVQNILQKCVVLLAGHAPSRTGVVTAGRGRVGCVAAENLGMDAGDGAAVSGQVDLGNDLDVAAGGIADDFAHLGLGVVAAVFLAPLAVDGCHRRVAAAESADGGQLGV